ncbi:MAG: alpha-L-fucosidase, partial [Lachnospiraceae bacterium]|nr:alpha-L-fucosidase [Lachnospiraceae bacterium]
MKVTKRIVVLMMAVAMVITSVTGPSAQTVQAYSVPANMKWWAQDKFGMFIHFGAYSYYGQGEWAMSEQQISKQKYQTEIAAKFNPSAFNANEIVKYAKKAGMKYIVITAKHHEGFSMWDTKV